MEHADHLSQGWRIGDLIFVGGQISADDRGRALGDDIETQTRNIMEFIGRVLHEAGADFDDIVKQNVYYVVDDESAPAAETIERIDAVRAAYCGSPGPIATETPVAGLAFEGLLLEIDALAVLGRDKTPLTPANHWRRGAIRGDLQQPIDLTRIRVFCWPVCAAGGFDGVIRPPFCSRRSVFRSNGRTHAMAARRSWKIRRWKL